MTTSPDTTSREGGTGASLIRADALRIPLRDNSVDLIVTSPPYFALRSYRDGGQHYDGQIGSEPGPHEFIAALLAVTAECMRVLKPEGSMFTNLGDKYAGSGGHNNSGVGGAGRGPSAYNKNAAGIRAKSLMLLPERYRIGCVDRLGLIVRSVIIWDKPNGLPESVTDRVRRSHEDWVHLTKQGHYYSAIDEIREEYSPASLASYAKGGLVTSVGDGQHPSKQNGAMRRDGNEEQWRGNPLGKLPGSVWRIASEPLKVPEHVGVDHHAAFPQEWPRRLILGWSPPGICTACGEGRRPIAESRRTSSEGLRPPYGAGRHGTGASTLGQRGVEAPITGYRCACPDVTAPTRPAVVFDPFVGTGTTVMVARTLGRHSVGLDLSADYLRLARWRVYDSGHANKTLNRTWTERQGTML